jgi:mono/diheme cytochrome c family protein/glucose/arabinose dehydrogenase
MIHRALLLLAAVPLVASAQEPATTPPAIKRAGGGPENPVLKFKLPPPKVLTPEEAVKAIRVPKGFRVEVVASEPMIEAPVAVSWDDQARMYVCEMRGYMHDMDAKGEDQPIGRISRLEDTDGDGVYDKSTVFTDKLLMPRAVMAIGDGALVSVPPNLIFMHDTDGDGVSDKQEVIHDAYAREGGQPEHMANSPTWMMDNWIWSTGHGFRYRYQGGTFLRESTTGFGQWGRTQDDWGRQYFNYNSDWLRLDLVTPGYYARNRRLATRTGVNHRTTTVGTTWPRVPTPGINRGYMPNMLRADGTLAKCTATCGAAVYRGDLFPKEYRGNVFIPEPVGLLVKRMVLSETGGVVSARHAYEGKEFLTSSDERFRPVNAYTGPDGALYIVDMARGVVQHKAFLTYYLAANIEARKLEQPLNLGRIYRIVPDGVKPQATKLPKASADIVPLLAHANGWVRGNAQRVLVERGDKSVVPAVTTLSAEGATPQARLHALWTLEGLGALTPEIVTARLQDKDTKVRTAAIRLADASLTPELVKLVPKANSELRLHLAFKLSDQPGPEVEQALIALLKAGAPPQKKAAAQPVTTPVPADAKKLEPSRPPEEVNRLALGEAVVSGLTGRELEFLEVLLKQPAAEDAKLAGTKIFETLAACVMSERRGSRVSRLLDLAAAQPAARQSAIFNSMAPKKPLPNPIRMEAEPAAFVALQKTAKGGLRTALAKIDAELYWPDKPGAKPLPDIPPLTAEQQASFEKGKALYAAVCAACHQPGGTGLANLAPPLANSEWALGPADRPIRAVLHGVIGPITVAGTKWDLEMPGFGAFGDEDIASIITYIRREWEHGASPVTGAEVAKVRNLTQGRVKGWTEAELKQPPGAPEMQAKAESKPKSKPKPKSKKK